MRAFESSNGSCEKGTIVGAEQTADQETSADSASASASSRPQPPAKCLWLTKGLGRGGVERLLVDMYPHVDPARFEVDVAYVLPWKDNYRHLLEEHGANVICLGSSRSGDPRWIYRLNRLLRTGGYDLVHSHAPLPGVATRTSPALGDSRPVIVHTEHNMWDRYRWPTRYLNAATYHRNAAAVAVSDSVASTIQPVLNSRRPPIRTILHGTELQSVRSWTVEQRRTRRQSLGLPEDGFLIGNVGNFTAKKDHRNLLTALTGSGPISQAHLALIGLGPLEEALRQAATELGVADRVTFLGSRDDVFELLPLFDAFCLSSKFEGFPIALVEAMATGLPCVSTSVGGIPEIMEDGINGLLCPAENSTALRTALERFMQDPELASTCGTNAQTSSETLDLRHAVRELESIYKDALENRAQ